MGSWIGRLAGQYRMTVEQLDMAYGIGLPSHQGLGWLAPGTLAASAFEVLAHLARLDERVLRSIDIPTSRDGSTLARYCPSCVFLNPVDVAQPYWKLEWLSSTVARCAEHGLALRGISGGVIVAAGNTPRLIRAVGALEQRRHDRER